MPGQRAIGHRLLEIGYFTMSGKSLPLADRRRLRFDMPWRKAICFCCLAETALQAFSTGQRIRLTCPSCKRLTVHRVMAEDYQPRGFAERSDVHCHPEVTIGQCTGSIFQTFPKHD